MTAGSRARRRYQPRRDSRSISDRGKEKLAEADSTRRDTYAATALNAILKRDVGSRQRYWSPLPCKSVRGKSKRQRLAGTAAAIARTVPACTRLARDIPGDKDPRRDEDFSVLKSRESHTVEFVAHERKRERKRERERERERERRGEL